MSQSQAVLLQCVLSMHLQQQPVNLSGYIVHHQSQTALFVIAARIRHHFSSRASLSRSSVFLFLVFFFLYDGTDRYFVKKKNLHINQKE